METLLGTEVWIFVLVTLVVMGLTAGMVGQALAGTWRPMWQIVPYGLMLGCVDRFFTWSLFGGDLVLLSGYLIDTLVILVIALIAFRLTQAYKMVTQYPWIYERSGLFGWREKSQG